jgi:hypothetical protein
MQTYNSIELAAQRELDRGFLGMKEAWLSVKSILKLFVSRRMLMLLPQISWTGISLAVYSGLLVPMITYTMVFEDIEAKLIKGMYAMIMLGVGEILGSLLIGQIIDRTKS